MREAPILDLSSEHSGASQRGSGRVFGHGGLRLVLLQLIADKPRHGYELIKAIEERLQGSYSPSPGVIYPTLTLLEEMGLVTVSADGGRKLHTATPAGTEHLAAHRQEVDALLARMDSGSALRQRHGASVGLGSARPERPAPIERALMNLRQSLQLRLAGPALAPEQVHALTDAIDALARQIERT